MTQPKTTPAVVVNSSVGAKVSISASIFCRKLTIKEDPAGAAAGLQIFLPDDNFTQAIQISATEEFPIFNSIAASGAHGSVVGLPAQTIKGEVVAATVVCKLLSVGAATKARITETP